VLSLFPSSHGTREWRFTNNAEMKTRNRSACFVAKYRSYIACKFPSQPLACKNDGGLDRARLDGEPITLHHVA
jgi:hypothetical protein